MTHLQLVGLTDADTGRVGRPMLTTSWSAPQAVEVVDGMVRWSASVRHQGSQLELEAEQPVEWSVGLFERFIRLADASDDRIAAAVAKLGPLIRRADFRRGEPGHDKRCPTCFTVRGLSVDRWHDADGRRHELLIDADGPGEHHGPRVPLLHGAEPVELWRDLANDVAVLLRIAAELRRGAAVDRALWQRLRVLDAGRRAQREEIRERFAALALPVDRRELANLDTLEQMEQAAGCIALGVHPRYGEWIEAGDSVLLERETVARAATVLGEGARMEVVWPEGRDAASMHWHVPTLLTAIGLQLQMALVNGRGGAFCDECAGWYAPTRIPRANEGHYCSNPDCQRRAATARKRRQRGGGATPD